MGQTNLLIVLTRVDRALGASNQIFRPIVQGFLYIT